MNLLDKFKAAGVLTFTVQDNEAIADNPYQPYQSMGSISKEIQRQVIANLPPLPTSGIPDGTVKIEDVEEQEQYSNKERGGIKVWNNRKDLSSALNWGYVLRTTNLYETRTALVMKEEELKTNINMKQVDNLTKDEAFDLRTAINGEFISKDDFTDHLYLVTLRYVQARAENCSLSMREYQYLISKGYEFKNPFLIPKALRKGEEEKSSACEHKNYKPYSDNVDSHCYDCKCDFVHDSQKPEKMEQTAEGIEPASAKKYLWSWLKENDLQDTGHSLELPFVWDAMTAHAESQLAQYKEKLIGDIHWLMTKASPEELQAYDKSIDAIKNS